MNNFKLIEKINKMIEGCTNIIEEKENVHKDAKIIARLVRQDCKELLSELKG